ncbi:MAG: topoisomerase DNA-binding C4 zinc finger domain-containing protein, partial [Candidatus Fibromonas sp.]|nr:topoisomerase DNA-binding C4 zinc finger domain-containing protein [Candidatus Fibromonas sp.]
NNTKSRMGFPSKMQDAPILELLLENSDSYPFSEERRLFYVALTRAKKKVILLTLKDRESVFVIELKSSYGKEMERESFTCPLCGGHLTKKTGPYSTFLGCSNWKNGDGCKYTRTLKSTAFRKEMTIKI